MATEKQIEANRRNALKSTGPVTPEGKARMRDNAVTHGLTASLRVLRSEDQEGLRQTHQSLVACYQPADTQESHLVLQVATLFWRLQRHNRIETTLLDCEGYANGTGNEEEITPDSFERGIAISLLENPNSLDKLSRYETRLRNQYLKTIQILRSIQKDRLRSQPVPAQASQSELTPVPGTITHSLAAVSAPQEIGSVSQSSESPSNVIEITRTSPAADDLLESESNNLKALALIDGAREVLEAVEAVTLDLKNPRKVSNQ
jgi:hypothetical protein